MVPEQTGQKVTGSTTHPGVMTSTTATHPVSSSSPVPAAGDDPRPIFRRSVALAGATIAAVRPEQLASPTPCGTYDVRQLIAHLLSVLDRVALVGRNENPFVAHDQFEPADGDVIGEWNRLAAEVDAAWADGAALLRPTMLPWAAESGALALRTYAAELTAHTWDLAQATGQQPGWDEEVLRTSLDVMREILPAQGRREMFDAIRSTLPEEMRGGPDPYEEAVPVDAGAPLIDQLVAHVGRRPA
jgi:uncharacterized protein (TIGR03086 family)